MKKILLILFTLCFLGSSPLFAKLSLSISSAEIAEDESFQMSLYLEGSLMQELPDFSPLQKDFKILSTSKNLSYQAINGQVKIATQWTLLLKPKKAGLLEIPALHLEKEQSKALHIKVLKTADALQNSRTSALNQKEILLEESLDQKKPWLHQLVIYTVKIYLGRPLLEANFRPPEIEDGLLVPLGNPEHSKIIKHDRFYDLETHHYAIFPQKSGSLLIKPPSLQALTYESIPQSIRVKGSPKKLEVKPAPFSANPKQAWLPAQSLQVEESWEPSHIQIKEGETLTRTISLRAKGLPAQFLPKLQPQKGEGWQVYEEGVEESNEIHPNNVIGTKVIKWTYLFPKAGNFSIPAQTLNWFNISSQTPELAHLSQRSFQIQSSELKSSSKPSSSSSSKKAILPSQPNEVSITSSKQSELAQRLPAALSEKPLSKTSFVSKVFSNFSDSSLVLSLPWILSFAFALLWLLTVFFWQQQKNARTNTKKYLLSNLKAACLHNEAFAAKEALLAFARKQWPEHYFLNLMEIDPFMKEEALRTELIALSKALYFEKGKDAWVGKPLWVAFNHYLSFLKKEKKKKKISKTLPPLHPI